MNHLQTVSRLNVITPGNPDYEYWNNRSANVRLKGRPSRIIPVHSIEELATALQETVNENYRLAIRGGGHCLENFVSDAAVNVIIDISGIKGIRYDPEFNAIEIMAGVTLGEIHEKLYNDWGVVLPTGEHPAIGIGGHIQGGAFGFLCRHHGLGADYLYAVEVLWINENRQVEKTIATLEEADSNRELWWAHTGGGAGNFGVVTRCWFRTPGVENKEPSKLLPLAPAVIETAEIDWDWRHINEESFQQLVSNYCNWSKQHAAYGTGADSLFATLHLWNKLTQKIQLKAVLTDAGKADEVLQDLLQALGKGMNISYRIERKKMTWLEFALRPFPDIFTDQKGSFKLKDAFLLEPFSRQQIKVVYNNLTKSDTPGGFIALATYGGKVNTIAADATASVQRSAMLTTACVAGWLNLEEENKYLEWVRSCYRDIYIHSGGVPVPDKNIGGCMIAHPDNDLADTHWNQSGLPWHTFYYQNNYPRLQRVKAQWDPLNIFQHTLSVQAEPK
ncbi:MAG: FAD-binding protein [Ginsengibacter sp.]